MPALQAVKPSTFSYSVLVVKMRFSMFDFSTQLFLLQICELNLYKNILNTYRNLNESPKSDTRVSEAKIIIVDFRLVP